MLIDSESIIRTKEYMEVMQAFIDGKEIECKKRFRNDNYRTANTPDWDFVNYAYRIKHSEPEFVYPIYKKLKNTPETVIEFHSIDTGIYVSVRKGSIYRPGDAANNMVTHTDSVWEDCDYSRCPKFPISSRDELVEHGIELPDYILNQLDEFEIERLKRKKDKLLEDTIELFEVVKFSDGKCFIKASLVSQNTIDSNNNLMKTGRSFIINQSTKQLVKVNNN